jgi:trans-aconitate 2-methyltransferase
VTHRWDPDRYRAFADERARPFLELVARVRAEAPRVVVDLGCGTGELTALLADRWPAAEVLGVDSSPEMVAAAGPTGRVRVVEGDLRDWRADPPVDVLVSNAALQWVPGHLDLLPRWVGCLAAGGWLAFQVPGNFAEPSHALRHRLAADPRYATYLRDVASPDAFGPRTYLESLHALGCTVDAWETTYLHVLQGEDPVFTWATGTGARPTLQALPEPLRTTFAEEYRAGLRAAYPTGPHGTVLPFRRVFVVAQRHDRPGSAQQAAKDRP